MKHEVKYPHDLTGIAFGRLTCIRPVGHADYGSMVWECQCSCGESCCIPRSSLISGKTRSCGCLRKESAARTAHSLRPSTDLTGMRVGRLLVLREAEKRNEQIWLCRCDCGTEKLVRRSSLMSARARSCGCLARELRTATRNKKEERKAAQTSNR